LSAGGVTIEVNAPPTVAPAEALIAKLMKFVVAAN
jgi:hypothetical protein